MRAVLLAALFMLVACREAEAPAPPEPVGAARIEAERAACERAGGRFEAAGPGRPLACVRLTPDAGRACAAATDCVGHCLARSGTCAPFTPLFGCHEVLTTTGARVTECLE
jgi:hypothetical protein